MWDKMEADNTRVEKEPKDFGSFGDLLGDNKSVTIINVKKLKAPEEIEDMEEDDVQDGTVVDLSSILKKLIGK